MMPFLQWFKHFSQFVGKCLRSFQFLVLCRFLLRLPDENPILCAADKPASAPRKNPGRAPATPVTSPAAKTVSTEVAPVAKSVLQNQPPLLGLNPCSHRNNEVISVIGLKPWLTSKQSASMFRSSLIFEQFWNARRLCAHLPNRTSCNYSLNFGEFINALTNNLSKCMEMSGAIKRIKI